MELSPSVFILIGVLFVIVAFLYASVGHGGASGYLAVLSFFAFAPKEMATTALLLNILVAGIAFIAYYRSGYFSLRLTLPFIITSVPFALIGGMIYVSMNAYTILLAVALLFAAFRLMVTGNSVQAELESHSHPSLAIALLSGALIGLLSGIVGVGGGIFLSPLIIIMKWANVKQTSASAACFIVLNSISGLIGRSLQGGFSVGSFLPWLIFAFVGGLMGSWWGTKRFSSITLRRLLAVVLVVAAMKMMFTVIH